MQKKQVPYDACTAAGGGGAAVDFPGSLLPICD